MEKNRPFTSLLHVLSILAHLCPTQCRTTRQGPLGDLPAQRYSCKELLHVFFKCIVLVTLFPSPLSFFVSKIKQVNWNKWSLITTTDHQQTDRFNSVYALTPKKIYYHIFLLHISINGCIIFSLKLYKILILENTLSLVFIDLNIVFGKSVLSPYLASML